ncbi:hypothetical protein EGH22_16185 [Halomicroarcula sp. F28]|uniref:hypothetical protein n=1 Tax=Haloarcula salinisoli TaxID=2487746 RepID=UPI001C72AAD3|nr:hypothetical protein [Halomicroarcula salinisoli]MBX0287874.1 hypothetical protein [Halomicroarcula salinisoli]
MNRTLLGVAVVVAVAVLATPALAEPANTSITGPDQVAPGDTVTYTFSLTNTRENETSYVVNASVPETWEIVDRTDDGSWRQSESRWVYRSVEPGATKEPSLTFSVPADTDAGNVSFVSRTIDRGGKEVVTVKNVTVEQDSSDGGGSDDDSSTGGSDDDSSTGGSDDDSSTGGSDDDSSTGGSDDGSSTGGSDDGSSTGGSDDDSSTGGSDDGSSTGGSDDDSSTGGSDDDSSTGGSDDDSSTGGSDDDTASAGGEATATEEPTTEREPVTETAGGSAVGGEPESETETDGAASNGGNTAFGVGIGALLVLGVGVGVVTARRRVSTDSGTERTEAEPETTARPTDSGLSASNDEPGGPDIDVIDAQHGESEATLTYATTRTSNKAIGDEIREIARRYASADAEDIGTQRLEATVTDGSQPVATWHICREWLDQFEDGTLSREEFERKVLRTMSLSD